MLPAHPVSLRLSGAVALARAGATASRLMGRGGTALPGLVALRWDPRLVQHLAVQLQGGSLVVAGTNGKTTTSLLAAAALEADGEDVVHNRAGSNLLRGVAATLAARTRLDGTLRAGARSTGLFEVDEAALPAVLSQVHPRVLLLTNLFRDQLDRYGELQTIAGRWRAAIAHLPAASTLVLNADDPLVASLGREAPCVVQYYGVDRWPAASPVTAPAASADSLHCPICAAPLRFHTIAYAHLGQWSCDACGHARPVPQVAATVDATSVEGSDLRIVVEGDTVLSLSLALAGRYNVYNAVAALAATVSMGVPAGVAGRAIAAQRGAFGRAETIAVDGRTIRLYLIKNPTGADEVLRVVAGGPREAAVLLLLNDLDADGRDVSWIWDAQFDLLAGWAGPLSCGGSRAEDIALRCKYAGLPSPQSILPGDVPRAVAESLRGVPRGGTLLVLATYTAMLAARAELARRGYVGQYWEEPR